MTGRIAFQGELGAYSHEACVASRPDYAPLPCRTFEDVTGYDDMVILREIEVESHCEHHLAPFLGKAYVAYLPGEKVVGISKLARVVVNVPGTSFNFTHAAPGDATIYATGLNLGPIASLSPRSPGLRAGDRSRRRSARRPGS